MCKRRWLLMGIMLTALGVGAAPLFENGATEWRVMRQTDGDVVVRYAVTELTRALKLVSGATFAVVDGDEPAAGDIFVGVDPTLPEPGDEVVVNKMDGGVLRLVGNEPRAALHAVYAFLQYRLGVRWVWPGEDGEFMPSLSTYEVPADLDWRHTPSIRYRGFHCCGDWYDRDNFVIWMARNFATTHRHGFKNDAGRKLGFYNMFSSHNANLSGNAALFEAHPEYYCELAGKRSKANICFSSEGAVDEVVKSLRSTIASYANPGYPLDVLSIFPADNQDYCQCAECKKMSVSTGWFRFYNKCVAKLKPDYPGLKFSTIAYQGYRDVPECDIPDTEFVEYATHGRCNFHPLGSDSSACPNSAADMRRMAGWDTAGVPVGQYAYEYDAFSRHGVYLPIWSLVEETVNQAVAHHHVVLLPEVGMSPRYGPAPVVGSIQDRMSEYLYALKMWDATLTREAWMADMTRTAFGPAAAEVAAYMNTMDDAWRAHKGHLGILTDAITTAPKVLTDAVRAQAEAQLGAAAAALDAAEAGGTDVTRFRGALERENVLFAQWTTLVDKAAGKATTVYAPRLKSAGAIGEGTATAYALADADGVAGATRVRIAWSGDGTSRGGRNVDKIVVEFLGDGLAGKALAVDIVSPGTDGSYGFRRTAGGEKSAEHVSGTGVPETFTPDWTVEGSAGVVRMILPAATFESVPLVGGTWGFRFSCTDGEDELAFPHVEGMTADTVFINRDAADRPLLYYYGRADSVGNIPSLKLEAAEYGFRMTVATNLAELAATEAGTRDYWIRLGSLGSFPTDFRDQLLGAVSEGGIAIFTSYWTMGLEKFFDDPTFKCTVGRPHSEALALRRATYILDGDYIRTPNNLYSSFTTRITPDYTQLPDDESYWTICLRALGKQPADYAGGDHPYLLYRRYGKGFVVVGSETIAGQSVFYSFLENFHALADKLTAEEEKEARVRVRPGEDLAAKVAALRADWTEDGEPKTLTVLSGTHQLAEELYIDFPLTLVGATGDPDDVIVEGNKTFRICTINHADAEVKDLTIAKGYCNNPGNIYGAGNAGVRICKPNNLDRSNAQWHNSVKGSGGKLTHCVVRDCTVNYFHDWGVVYLNGPKDKTIVDRCIITGNKVASHQTNTIKNHGLILEVACGILRNTLVAGNTITGKEGYETAVSASLDGVACVNGADAKMVNCTIANNAITVIGANMVSGVYAINGLVLNCLIAENKIAAVKSSKYTYPAELYEQHRVWGGKADCFSHCVVDWSGQVNETCCSVADAGFADAANGDYRLLTESAAVGFGSTTASEAMGDLDLAGNARLRGGVIADAGAYAMTEGGEMSARFSATPSGRGNEPMHVTLAAYTMGLGEPITYLWDFDSDGTVDVATNENVFAYDFPMGQYSVTLTATNEMSGAACSVTEADLLDVRIGSGTYVVDAKDGADAFQRKYDQIAAAEGSTAVYQEFVLKPGTYTITNEVMLTCPWVVRGSTGNPADVIIDVQNKNKAFCLNHAKARLESLTVSRAKCAGVNSYGVVRICNPNGRGNQTNSTKGAGDGGVVSNVVLTACAGTDKLTGQLLLVNAGAGVATHCVITNCTGWQQSDASGGGMFLQVSAGRADNCLVANNSFECKDVGAPKDETCSSSVRVAGGTLVNCTVANNRTSGLMTTLCAGVHVSSGKAVNTVIAANDSRSSRANYSAWTGVAANFVSCLVEPDYELPNDTCVAGYPLFISPLNRDYRLSAASPCRNVGTNATTWTYGATDLAGLPRQRDVGGETTIDLGAYQYDETVVEPSRVHYVDANGTNPVSPYDTPETAATDVFDALKVTDWGHELRLLPGVHPVAKSVDITRDHITVCGTTGDPKDVVIRAVTSSNRCMKVNAGAHTLVHSLTLADGRGGSGGPAKGRNSVYGACLVVADVSQITSNGSGDDSLGSVHRGGTVSNCIVRGGLFTGKNCTSSGVFAYGPDALITHSVISNNVNGGFYTDNGCFGATGLVLGNGARGEHCLITKNRYYDNSNYGYYKAAAWVQGGSVLRYSTVYGNVSTLVGGVNVSGSGRFEKCVIAGNTIGRSDTTDPRHAVWGAFDFAMGTTYYRKDLATHLADEEARHLDEAVQARVTTNASNVAEADLGPGSLTVETRLLFAHPKRGDFHPRPSSPTVDAVPVEAETAAMPEADLKGNRRLFGDGYDLGAVEGNYKGLMLLVK